MNPDKGESRRSRWDKFKRGSGGLFRNRLKSRREKWDDVVLLVLLFYVIPACFVYATYEDLQVQPYTPIFPKPNNHERSMELTLNFYSTTFGATDRVHVYITITPDDVSKQEYLAAGTHDTPPGIGLPKYYYLGFQGSLCDSREDIFRDLFKAPVGCQIRVPYVESEGVYKNNAYFTYPVSGLYHVELSDEERQSSTRIDEKPGFVQIEPLESYLTYKNNKVLVILMIIGTYLGGVGIYSQWRQTI